MLPIPPHISYLIYFKQADTLRIIWSSLDSLQQSYIHGWNSHTKTPATVKIKISVIIESVDSISRDGPDTPIYAIHYKYQKKIKMYRVLDILCLIIIKFAWFSIEQVQVCVQKLSWKSKSSVWKTALCNFSLERVTIHYIAHASWFYLWITITYTMHDRDVAGYGGSCMYDQCKQVAVFVDHSSSIRWMCSPSFWTESVYFFARLVLP